MVKSGRVRLVNGTVSPSSEGLQAVMTDFPTGPPFHQPLSASIEADLQIGSKIPTMRLTRLVA